LFAKKWSDLIGGGGQVHLRPVEIKLCVDPDNICRILMEAFIRQLIENVQ